MRTFNRLLTAALSLCLATLPLNANGEGQSSDAAVNPAGRIFYLDSAAAKGGDGTTPETAWNSFYQAFSVTFQPGDRILLKRGSVWNNAEFAPRGSGTADNPIVVDCYGEEGPLPRINRDGRVVYGVLNDTAALTLTDVSYWTVRNLHLTNTNPAAPGTLDEPEITDTSVTFPMRSCLSVTATAAAADNTVRGICLENILITDLDTTVGDEYNCYNWRVKQIAGTAGGAAINVQATGGAKIDGLTIQGCELYNTGGIGISVLASHWQYTDAVRNLVIRHNTIGADADFDQSNNGIYVVCAWEPRIEYNHLYNLTNGIALQVCHGGTVQYNTVQNMDGYLHYMSRYTAKDQRWDGCGIDADCLCEGDIVFRNNYVRDCYEGAFAFFDHGNPTQTATITMENNLIQDCNRLLYYQCSNQKYTFLVKNNTFVRAADCRFARSKDMINVDTLSYLEGIRLEYNVFDTDGVEVWYAAPSAVYTNNLYHLDSERDVPAEDTAAIRGDPLYIIPTAEQTAALSYTGSIADTQSWCDTDYFTPAPTSPCRQNGTVVYGVDPQVFRQGKQDPSTFSFILKDKQRPSADITPAPTQPSSSLVWPTVLAVGAAAAVTTAAVLGYHWYKRRKKP